MYATVYAMMEVKGTKRNDDSTTTRRAVVMKSQRVGCLFSAHDEKRDPKSYRSKAGKSRQMGWRVPRRQSGICHFSLFLTAGFAILVRHRSREGKHHWQTTHAQDRARTLDAGVDGRTKGMSCFQDCNDSFLNQISFFFVNSSDNYQSNKRVQEIFWRDLEERKRILQL
jgi:hypothetical protein